MLSDINSNPRLGLFIPTFKRNYNDVSASIWIRCLQMIPYYKNLGYEVHLNNPFIKYDYTIFYRGVDKKAIYIIKYLKLISKKVYWDTCVNYFDKHYANHNWQVSNAKKIAKLVDGIIVPTKILYSISKKYNNNVLQSYDSINLEYFNKKKENLNLKHPLFGWSGVSNKSLFLNKYSKFIDGNILLVTDCNIKKQNLDFKYKYIEWNYNTFYDTIMDVDICIAPRNFSNSYDMMHSSFKILVYAICGIPIITNKLPSYVELSDRYDFVFFLEDYNNFKEILKDISNIKVSDINTKDLIFEYSCESSAIKITSFLESNNGE